MASVSNNIIIDARVSQVWAVLTDLTTVQEYNPLVSRAFYLTDKHDGIGVSRQCDLQGGGFVRERIVAWQPVARCGIEVFTDSDPDSPFTRQVSYFALTVTPNGTRVRLRFEYALKDDTADVAERCAAQVAIVLLGLKRYIETGESVLPVPVPMGISA